MTSCKLVGFGLGSSSNATAASTWEGPRFFSSTVPEVERPSAAAGRRKPRQRGVKSPAQ